MVGAQHHGWMLQNLYLDLPKTISISVSVSNDYLLNYVVFNMVTKALIHILYKC